MLALDTQTLATELLGATGSLRRALRHEVGRPAGLSSLSGAQLELARLVARRPAVSVADAARELRVAPNTVSTLVRQLTEAGVLIRRADTGDRRVARLELVPSVRESVESWRDRRAVALAAAVEQLSDEERHALEASIEVLSRLADEVDG
jgi:DNA-binding MarR family transcriptional regulator